MKRLYYPFFNYLNFFFSFDLLVRVLKNQEDPYTE